MNRAIAPPALYTNRNWHNAGAVTVVITLLPGHAEHPEIPGQTQFHHVIRLRMYHVICVLALGGTQLPAPTIHETS